ncbi:hypothetical protein KRR38_09925 [Novosphingobium sp. G106]|uniref:hypothetical protein n=1 Tax=Novosphingobium sp. G106 TaxID=2849500 RepID=UPI001C2DD03F|nr:hypothetical protein [Novosphingobium sp. G106]MBV1687983.1 hypothetical protein [Novosphingobium sp. G106]
MGQETAGKAMVRRYLFRRNISVALIGHVALGGSLALANDGPPVTAPQPEPMPTELQAGFQKCDAPLFLVQDAFRLQNKVHTAGCKVEYRLLARLSRLPEFSKLAFSCPVIVTLDRKHLPFASISYVTPSRCDLAGQKIENALMVALLPIRFDALDPEIGDSIMFSVDLRVAAARGTAPEPSAMFAFLRQDGMDLDARSRLVTFANRDKLPPLPPPPNSASGPGMSFSGGARAAHADQFARAWQAQVGKQAAAAIRSDSDLDRRLRKKAWSVTVRVRIGGDQTLRTVDILAATGAAENQADAIKAALLTIDRIEQIPGQPGVFFGPITFAISGP